MIRPPRMAAPEGVVVWMTGRPSSGKSTLASRVRDRLAAQGLFACVLDGDEVRSVLRPSPGYAEADRQAFYETLAGLAALLASQGLVVLVAATAHRAEFRARARAMAPRFVEVYVDVAEAAVQARDTKGLYARARTGELAGVPGGDLAYEAPERPDVVATGGEDDDAVAAILQHIRPDG